jgi:hypothetical protein
MVGYNFTGPFKGRFSANADGDIWLKGHAVDGHNKWAYAYVFSTKGIFFKICRAFASNPETHLKVFATRAGDIRNVATFTFPISTPLEAIIQDVDCSLLSNKEFGQISVDLDTDMLYYNNPDAGQSAAEGTMAQYVETYIGGVYSMGTINVRRNETGYECKMTHLV